MATLINGKPLMFGDIDQIRHVKVLRAKEAIREERERAKAAGELVEYDVELKVEGYHRVTVEASNSDDARNIALEEFNAWDVDDLDCNIESCREVSG